MTNDIDLDLTGSRSGPNSTSSGKERSIVYGSSTEVIEKNDFTVPPGTTRKNVNLLCVLLG
jgi:hypothetical protein